MYEYYYSSLLKESSNLSIEEGRGSWSAASTSQQGAHTTFGHCCTVEKGIMQLSMPTVPSEVFEAALTLPVGVLTSIPHPQSVNQSWQVNIYYKYMKTSKSSR